MSSGVRKDLGADKFLTETPSLMSRSLTTIAGTVAALYSAIVPSLQLCGYTLHQIAGWLQLAAPYIKFIPVVGSAILAGGAAIHAMADGYALWELQKKKKEIESKLVEEGATLEESQRKSLESQKEAIDRKISFVTTALLINVLFFCLGTALATAEALLVWTGFPIVGVVLSALFLAGTALRLQLLREAVKVRPSDNFAEPMSVQSVDFNYDFEQGTCVGFLEFVNREARRLCVQNPDNSKTIKQLMNEEFKKIFPNALDNLPGEISDQLVRSESLEDSLKEIRRVYGSGAINAVNQQICALNFLSDSEKAKCLQSLQEGYRRRFDEEIDALFESAISKVSLKEGEQDSLERVLKDYRSAEEFISRIKAMIALPSVFSDAERLKINARVTAIAEEVRETSKVRMRAALNRCRNEVTPASAQGGGSESGLKNAYKALKARLTDAESQINSLSLLNQSQKDLFLKEIGSIKLAIKQDFSEKCAALSANSRKEVPSQERSQLSGRATVLVEEAGTLDRLAEEVTSTFAQAAGPEATFEQIVEAYRAANKQLNSARDKLDQLPIYNQRMDGLSKIRSIRLRIDESFSGKLSGALGRLAEEVTSTFAQAEGSEATFEQSLAACQAARAQLQAARTHLMRLGYPHGEQKEQYLDQLEKQVDEKEVAIFLAFQEALSSEFNRAAGPEATFEQIREAYRAARTQLQAGRGKIQNLNSLTSTQMREFLESITQIEQAIKAVFDTKMVAVFQRFEAEIIAEFNRVAGPEATFAELLASYKAAEDQRAAIEGEVNGWRGLDDNQWRTYRGCLSAMKEKLKLQAIEKISGAFEQSAAAVNRALAGVTAQDATLEQILDGCRDAEALVRVASKTIRSLRGNLDSEEYRNLIQVMNLQICQAMNEAMPRMLILLGEVLSGEILRPEVREGTFKEIVAGYCPAFDMIKYVSDLVNQTSTLNPIETTNHRKERLAELQRQLEGSFDAIVSVRLNRDGKEIADALNAQFQGEVTLDTILNAYRFLVKPQETSFWEEIARLKGLSDQQYDACEIHFATPVIGALRQKLDVALELVRDGVEGLFLGVQDGQSLNEELIELYSHASEALRHASRKISNLFILGGDKEVYRDQIEAIRKTLVWKVAGQEMAALEPVRRRMENALQRAQQQNATLHEILMAYSDLTGPLSDIDRTCREIERQIDPELRKSFKEISSTLLTVFKEERDQSIEANRENLLRAINELEEIVAELPTEANPANNVEAATAAYHLAKQKIDQLIGDDTTYLPAAMAKEINDRIEAMKKRLFASVAHINSPEREFFAFDAVAFKALREQLEIIGAIRSSPYCFVEEIGEQLGDEQLQYKISINANSQVVVNVKNLQLNDETETSIEEGAIFDMKKGVFARLQERVADKYERLKKHQNLTSLVYLLRNDLAEDSIGVANKRQLGDFSFWLSQAGSEEQPYQLIHLQEVGGAELTVRLCDEGKVIHSLFYDPKNQTDGMPLSKSASANQKELDSANGVGSISGRGATESPPERNVVEEALGTASVPVAVVGNAPVNAPNQSSQPVDLRYGTQHFHRHSAGFILLNKAVEAFASEITHIRPLRMLKVHQDAIAFFPKTVLRKIVSGSVGKYIFLDDILGRAEGTDAGGLTRQVVSTLATSLFDPDHPNGIKMSGGMPALLGEKSNRTDVENIGYLFCVSLRKKAPIGNLLPDHFFDALFLALTGGSRIEIAKALYLNKDYQRICAIEARGSFTDEDQVWFQETFKQYPELCDHYSREALDDELSGYFTSQGYDAPQTAEEIKPAVMKVIKEQFKNDTYIRLFEMHSRSLLTKEENDCLAICAVEARGSFTEEDQQWLRAAYPELYALYSEGMLDEGLSNYFASRGLPIPQTREDVERYVIETIKASFKENSHDMLLGIHAKQALTEAERAWLEEGGVDIPDSIANMQSWIEHVIFNEFLVADTVDAVTVIAEKMKIHRNYEQSRIGANSTELRMKIQGESLTGAELFMRIEFPKGTDDNPLLSQKKIWLREHVEALDARGVKGFTQLITAAPTLSPGKKIYVEWTAGDCSQAHTCSSTLDLPNHHSTAGTPPEKQADAPKKVLFMNNLLLLYSAELFGMS